MARAVKVARVVKAKFKDSKDSKDRVRVKAKAKVNKEAKLPPPPPPLLLPPLLPPLPLLPLLRAGKVDRAVMATARVDRVDRVAETLILSCHKMLSRPVRQVMVLRPPVPRPVRLLRKRQCQSIIHACLQLTSP